MDDKFPTACVSRHADSNIINLIVGKHFWEVICKTDEMKIGILKHELLHVINEHLLDRESASFPNKYLANIAMDISINQCIPEALPRVDDKGNKIGVFIDDFHELKMKYNESSYYYYNILAAKKEEKEKSKGKCDSLNGPKGNKKGTSGSVMLDKILDDMDENAYPDIHSEWDKLTKGMSQAEKDAMRDDIKDQLVKIAEEAQKSRGTVPGNISTIISNIKVKKPVVSWQVLFRRFIGTSFSTDIKHNRKRPNFRFEDNPTTKYKTKVKIIVGCDSSGSVSKDELDMFFSEIRHMYKAGVHVDISIWDATCEPHYKFKGENTYKRTKAGGTHASCFIKYVNEKQKKNQWTCAICLTDGYIEHNPIKANLPFLWLITKNGDTSFKHHGRKVKFN
jgi:predicted metal-dependent peptidase